MSKNVSIEYKDLAKFAEDTDSHLFREELEDSLKKAKERHYSLRALKPKTKSSGNHGGSAHSWHITHQCDDG